MPAGDDDADINAYHASGILLYPLEKVKTTRGFLMLSGDIDKD